MSYRQLLVFSLPSILSTLLEPLASLVDTALVGRLDTQWLAALAISATILNSFTWVFNFLVHATIAGVSSAGEDNRLLQKRVRIALVVALAVGILSALLVWVGRFFLYDIAGAEAELVDTIDRYFALRILGHPFLILYICALSILRGLGRVHIGFVLMATTTTMNIAASWFFLYVQKTDLIGAAYGTVLANVLGLLPTLLILLRDPRLSGMLARWSIESSHWFHFGKNSLDVFLRTLALSLVFFVATRFAASLGSVHLAAHQVLLQLYLFSSYFTDGLATSATILGGRKVAAQKLGELKIIFRKLLHLGAIVGAFFSLVYGLAGLGVIGIFTQDDQVQRICLALWPIIFLTQIPSSLAFTYDGLMFGLGEFAYLRKHIIIGASLVFLPLAAGFSLYGLGGIWGGLAAMNAYRLVALKWRIDKRLV